MLYFLVNHLRESLDRRSLVTVTETGASEPATLPEGDPTADVRQAIGSVEWQASDAHGRGGISSSVRSRAASLLIVLAASVTLGGVAGCTCLRRAKVDANVVSARQCSLRGVDALQRGQWDEAEQHFATALRKNPADERAHRHYAEILWQRGELPNAIRHQEESVRLSGGDPSLLVQLGEMYLNQKNVEAASECADEAIECNQLLCGAWALRADIHRSRGETDAALECYHRALNQQPHYPHVQLALADLYMASGRARRALGTLESLASQYSPDGVPPEVEFRRGLTLMSLGRYQDAVDRLASAAQRAEPTADLLSHLAEAQFLAGNSASARLAVQAALAKSPNHSASLKLRDRIERSSQTMTAAVDRR